MTARSLGKISKRGNCYLRVLFVQAAWVALIYRRRDDRMILSRCGNSWSLRSLQTSALSAGDCHMLRAVLAVVAIAVVTVTMPDRIKPCCTSANAQTQTKSHEPAIWDHNGSVMYLAESGSSREFHYQKPRPGMLEAGARPGSLLFRGQVDNGQYSGTAYIFDPRCGAIPFQAKGPVLDNDERIILTGQMPKVGRNCRTYGSYTGNLEFRRLKPADVAQSQEAPEATQALGVEQSKSETPSGTETGNSPSRGHRAQGLRLVLRQHGCL